MRFSFTREFYIPQGAVKVADKLSDAVAYLYRTKDEKPAVAMFYGKQTKPVFRFRYSTEAKREEAIRHGFESRQQRQAMMKDRRGNEKRAKLEVGHILNTCWGYDQTNREFYQVTKLIGSSMVEVREIAQVRGSTGWETGTCTPRLDEFIGEPKRCRINGYGVRVDNHLASIWEGQPLSWSATH